MASLRYLACFVLGFLSCFLLFWRHIRLGARVLYKLRLERQYKGPVGMKPPGPDPDAQVPELRGLAQALQPKAYCTCGELENIEDNMFCLRCGKPTKETLEKKKQPPTPNP